MKKDFKYENPIEKEKLKNAYIIFGAVVILVILSFVFLSGGRQEPYQQTSFTGPPPENKSTDNITCQNDECWLIVLRIELLPGRFHYPESQKLCCG